MPALSDGVFHYQGLLFLILIDPTLRGVQTKQRAVGFEGILLEPSSRETNEVDVMNFN